MVQHRIKIGGNYSESMSLLLNRLAEAKLNYTKAFQIVLMKDIEAL